MSDAPIAAETPAKLTLTELAKPVEKTTAPPTPETPPTPPSPADARATLAEIAAGPEKQKVDALLAQSTQLLLDAGDKRAVLAALAHHVAPTPLGTELRRDVITSIAEMKPGKLTPEQSATLANLQKDIAGLALPKTDAARSEFAKFLEDFSKEHPDKAINPTLIEAVRTNKLDRAAEVANILQSDSTLSAKLHEQFKGDRTEPLANVASADGLLAAAGLPASPENRTKAAKVFEPPPMPDTKSLKSMTDYIMPTLMGVALVSMFMNQFTGGGSEGGGH